MATVLIIFPTESFAKTPAPTSSFIPAPGAKDPTTSKPNRATSLSGKSLSDTKLLPEAPATAKLSRVAVIIGLALADSPALTIPFSREAKIRAFTGPFVGSGLNLAFGPVNNVSKTSPDLLSGFFTDCALFNILEDS